MSKSQLSVVISLLSLQASKPDSVVPKKSLRRGIDISERRYLAEGPCCFERGNGYQSCMTSDWCNNQETHCENTCNGLWLEKPLEPTGCCKWYGTVDCSTIDYSTNPGCHYRQDDCEGSCNGQWVPIVPNDTSSPTQHPTSKPTQNPVTIIPTYEPNAKSTKRPTSNPIRNPTAIPTFIPTEVPTLSPF